MKRLIAILLIIIIIAAIVLGGSWLLSRRTAQKNGTDPLSFREFVTGSTKDGEPGSELPGELSSGFGNETEGGGNTTPITGSPSATSNTTTSIFTENSFTPSSQGGDLNPTDPSRGAAGDGTPGGNSSTGGPGSATGGTTPVQPGVDTPIAVCTSADLNITFTPDELKKLQALQERFYEVATTLHNDGDVQTQLSNYNALKSKLDRYRELNRYCVNNLAPKIATLKVSDFVPDVAPDGRIGGLWNDGSGENNNGIYMYINDAFKNKVPTPFWFEIADIRIKPRPPAVSIFNILQNQDQFATINNFTTQMQTIQQIRERQAAGNNSQNLTAEQIALEQQVQQAIDSGLLGTDSIPVGYLSPTEQIAGDVGACQGYNCPEIFRRTMEAFLRLNLW